MIAAATGMMTRQATITVVITGSAGADAANAFSKRPERDRGWSLLHPRSH
jgi:hypothetical protein